MTNATGYKIIVDNGDPIDLGDIRTYTINPGSSYYVIAYTTNEEYYGESKTALIEPECVLSGNLQAEKNYDFESAITLAAGSGWSAYPYGNWGSTSENDSYGPAYIIQDLSGNTCLKIQATAWWPHGVAVWKDLSTNLLTAGTYKVIMDVKLGEPIHTSGSGETLKYDTLTCVLFYNGGQINATSGNIISCTDTGWTRVEYVFSYASDLTDYVQLAMYYWPELTIDNNYVLIDNIKVVAADDANETNLDTKGCGNFEDFYKPTSNVWFGGQFSVLAETSSVGSSIILNGDNHVLKVYNSSSSDNCFIDVTGNALELRQVGTYKVTIKVKTSNVANLGLGFCYYTANGKMGGDVNFSSEEMSKVNNEGWTEITVYYQITEESNAEWANMFFWVYDHNTTNDPSVYTLIDNVVIQRVTGYTIN